MADDKLEERVVTELKRLIVEELDLHLAPTEINPDASLFEGGLGIDSIAIVELIAVAEEHFEVKFADDDLVESSFSSIRTFAKMICAKPGLQLDS
jgi:acyl carrier protein